MTRPLGLAVLLALTACDDPAVLNQRLDDIEARADKVESDLSKAGGGAASGADQAAMEKEKAAYEKWKEMMQARQDGDMDAVKKHIAEIERDFADTRAMQEIQPIKQELELIGKDAMPLSTDTWFTGQTSLDDGKATLVVFWEVWCPHCQREVPELQATWEKYGDKGLNMVGVTQLSRGKTEDEVRSFIETEGVTYPMAKVGPEFPEHYAVRGIPAAAVVKDGKIVWRGHPAQVDEAMIQSWIGS
jgi:thiol-disulfide isomerase/thioredoxin